MLSRTWALFAGYFDAMPGWFWIIPVLLVVVVVALIVMRMKQKQ